MKKRILVTGGAGYIGSHTVVELCGAGYDVVIVDDLSNSYRSVVEGIEQIVGRKVTFVECDCCDSAKMKTVFAEYPFDAVIHFAASKAVGESMEQPLKYYSNNLGSFITVLESMREYGVQNIIFSSSATVYGQADVLPPNENAPLKKALSPYGNTKQICEDILTDSIAAYDTLNGIILRYFNPVGAHPSALIGELPQGRPNNLVPFITQTAAGWQPKLKIFGGDYNTPDGTALRDYIDVVDLAVAHVSAMNRLFEKGNKLRREVFNIGTGRPVSVLELVETFEKINGVPVPHDIVARRSGDVESLWADATLANKVLGWHAARTLEETLASAWKWQQSLGEKRE